MGSRHGARVGAQAAFLLNLARRPYRPQMFQTLNCGVMPKSHLVIALVFLVGACATASSGGTAAQQGCALIPSDTVYLKAGPVYRECAVEQRAAVMDRSAYPDFNLSSPPPGGQACYTAEIEFVVDERGIPEMETATVLRTNDRDYAQAAVRAVARWRYRPALLHRSPVRQIVKVKENVAVAVVAVPAGEPLRAPRAPLC